MSIFLPFLRFMIKTCDKDIENIAELERMREAEIIEKKVLKVPFIYLEIDKEENVIEEYEVIEDLNAEDSEKSRKKIAKSLYNKGFRISRKASQFWSKLKEDDKNKIEKIHKIINDKDNFKKYLSQKKSLRYIILYEDTIFALDYEDGSLKKVKKLEKKETRESKIKNITSREIRIGGYCIICERNSSLELKKEEFDKYVSDISNIFEWLVKPDKNITFIRDIDGNNYLENIFICRDCLDKIKKTNIIEYLFKDKYYFKFKPVASIKVFPYVYEDEEFNTKILEEIKHCENLDGLFRYIENIIENTKKTEIYPRTFFDLIFYRVERKKINILYYIEDIRLSNIKIVYDVLDTTRSNTTCKREGYNLFTNPNILYFFLGDLKKEKESFYFSILEKILKLERFDSNEEKYIYFVINNKLREIFYSMSPSEQKEIVNSISYFLKFIKLLNERVKKDLNRSIISDDSPLLFEL